MFQYRVPIGPEADILGISAQERNSPNPLMNLLVPKTHGYETDKNSGNHPVKLATL